MTTPDTHNRAEPVDLDNLAEQTGFTEPAAAPARPAGAVGRACPAGQTEPASSDPVEPASQAEPAKPAEPADSDPLELARQAEFAKPAEPAAAGRPGLASQTEPGDSDPAEAASHAGFGDPAEPGDLADPDLASQADPAEAPGRSVASGAVELGEPPEPEPGFAGAAEAGEPADLDPGSQDIPAGPGELAEPAAAGEEEDELLELAAVRSDLPDLTEDAHFEAAIESLLLVVDSPAEEELLASALDAPIARVSEALDRMAAQYTEQQRGIDLRRVGGGWRFYTRDKFAPFVEKLLLDGQRARLTRAALETLAVIAYRQPVTRQRVAAVRGVNVDGVIRTLLARGLIEETGTDSDTGGFLFRTTELFLERIGLSSLEDLPPIAPLLPEVDAIDDV